MFGGVLRGPGGFGVEGVVDGSMTGFQFAALGVESAHCAGFPQSKLQGCGYHSESIFHAAAEVDRRGFFEIFRGAGNFSPAEAESDALGEHLIVKDKSRRSFLAGAVR